MLCLDSHVDIPWPDGPDFAADGARRVDLPKLKRGGVNAVCFAAYVPQGPCTEAAEAVAHARARDMLGRIRTMGAIEGTRLATEADAIEAAARDGMVAIIPAVENGHAVGADLGRLAALRALGARYVTMTHNGHNAWADSAVPRADLGDAPELHGGLSVLGRAAVAEMNRLAMVIDVSHLSKAAMMQALALSRAPVAATHSCARALCDHPRNLDDEQLAALRDTGGVAQITAVSYFVKARASELQGSVADFADHVDHAARVAGIAHVGIGSDFDGGGGLSGWRDAAETPTVTAELRRRGYDDGALAALWGGNFLRVLRQAEQVAG